MSDVQNYNEAIYINDKQNKYTFLKWLRKNCTVSYEIEEIDSCFNTSERGAIKNGYPVDALATPGIDEYIDWYFNQILL